MGNKINEGQMVDILNAVYSKALNGIPKISQSVENLVSDYTESEGIKRKTGKSL